MSFKSRQKRRRAKQEETQIGRLAMRHEGEYWNAYYAVPDNMTDAVHLGSIRISACVRNPQVKAAFTDLMREVVGDIIEDAIGIRPGWGGERPAPEHERAGHS